jgi:DNA-binding XRE family transcriptional regulator
MLDYARSLHPMFPFSRHAVVLKRAVGKGHIKNPQTIGNHIRNRRYELKMTQKALAAQFGVCLSSIVRWEGGAEQPLKKQLPQITQFLGYEPECAAAPRPPKTQAQQKALF